MPSVGRELRDSLEACLSSVAGPEYIKMKYLDLLEKNTSKAMSGKGYGVRPLDTFRNLEIEVTRGPSYTQTFQFVLTKKFGTQGVGDSAQYEAYLDLHEIALSFINKVAANHTGLHSRALNVPDFNIAAPQFLEDKVAVLIGNIDINYRFQI